MWRIIKRTHTPKSTDNNNNLTVKHLSQNLFKYLDKLYNPEELDNQLASSKFPFTFTETELKNACFENKCQHLTESIKFKQLFQASKQLHLYLAEHHNISNMDLPGKPDYFKLLTNIDTFLSYEEIYNFITEINALDEDIRGLDISLNDLALFTNQSDITYIDLWKQIHTEASNNKVDLPSYLLIQIQNKLNKLSKPQFDIPSKYNDYGIITISNQPDPELYLPENTRFSQLNQFHFIESEPDMDIILRNKFNKNIQFILLTNIEESHNNNVILNIQSIHSRPHNKNNILNKTQWQQVIKQAHNIGATQIYYDGKVYNINVESII